MFFVARIASPQDRRVTEPVRPPGHREVRGNLAGVWSCLSFGGFVPDRVRYTAGVGEEEGGVPHLPHQKGGQDTPLLHCLD